MVGREGGSTPQIAKVRVAGEGLHQRTLSEARTKSQTPEPYTFLRAHEVLSAAQGRSPTMDDGATPKARRNGYAIMPIANLLVPGGIARAVTALL